nr:ABC transporter substrate-binding protein [uncultured Pseudomonas sp.]
MKTILYRRSFCLALCICLFGASPAYALTLYTEEYPPLNFTRDGKPTGLGVEVVQEILQRTGQRADIQVVPWSRGYRAAQTEADTGLFVTMRTQEREKLFKWVGPIIVALTSFYALEGSGLSIASLEDAKALGTIAVPRQWYSFQTLKAQGMDNVYGVLGPRQMMTMLRHRRVPLVVADNITLASLLALAGLKPADVEPLYTFMSTRAYIAFSLNTDDELVGQWQTTLDQMKADGRFEAIYHKWLPGSPLPE